MIPRGKTEVTVSDDLATAFEQSQAGGLEPEWIQEEDVTGLSPTKTVKFIQGDLVSTLPTAGRVDSKLSRKLYEFVVCRQCVIY